MRTQTEWLFEAPLALEAVSYGNPYTYLEDNQNSELIEDCRNQTSDCPPSRVKPIIISGYSTHNTNNPSEKLGIKTAADIIVRSANEGSQSIKVCIVGHADKDPRGEKFERDISRQRAVEAKNALTSAISNPSVLSKINWKLVCAGKDNPVVGFNKPLAQRVRNRRVEIFVASSPSPPRPTPLVCSAISSSQCEKEFERCLKTSNNPLACLASRSVCYRNCSPPTPPTPPTPPPLPIPSSTPPPPIARTCCILAPTLSPFSSTSNLISPTGLGGHRSSSEATGLIYTGKAGFFDLGHVRDLCDLTKYVYDQIVSVGGVPVAIRTIHGTAIIHTPVPSSAWLQVARAISYDDSFAYEIYTYDEFSPGGHNSSFSPEDLCSNYLGTLLAEKGILAGGTFNAAVTSQLSTMVGLLDAQTETESLRAFNLINGCWASFSGPSSLLNNAYLKRRNFARIPWFTEHSSDSLPPAWVTAGFGSATTFYTYTHKVGRTIDKADFPKEIARIRTDAAKRYGSKFDDRKCP